MKITISNVTAIEAEAFEKTYGREEGETDVQMVTRLLGKFAKEVSNAYQVNTAVDETRQSKEVELGIRKVESAKP